MPKLEYHCEQCGHNFERVTLHGDQAAPVRCPKCGGDQVKSAKGPISLFNGIANFSSLAKDRN